MATMVWKKRHDGGYRYHTCSECGHEDTIQKPIEVSLPYCGGCGMYVADAAHKFCGFCGERFEDGDTNV